MERHVREQWIRLGAYRITRPLTQEERAVIRSSRRPWYSLADGCFTAIAAPAIGLFCATIVALILLSALSRLHAPSELFGTIFLTTECLGLAGGIVGYFWPLIQWFHISLDLRAGTTEVIGFPVHTAVAVQMYYWAADYRDPDLLDGEELPADDDPPMAYFLDLGNDRLMFVLVEYRTADPNHFPCNRIEHARTLRAKVDLHVYPAGELLRPERTIRLLRMPEAYSPTQWGIVRGAAATLETDLERIHA